MAEQEVTIHRATSKDGPRVFEPFVHGYTLGNTPDGKPIQAALRIQNEDDTRVWRDNPRVYAKHSRSESGTDSYYVLCFDGLLFNPLGDREQTFVLLRRSEADFARLRFIEVSAKSFNYYLKYLTTRNPSWLNNAQREV